MLQHVLPKGLRRARNHGFLHPNSKRLIALLRLLVFRQPPPAARALFGPRSERTARLIDQLELQLEELEADAGADAPQRTAPQPPAAQPATQRPKLVCRCCGEPMIILQRHIPPTLGEPPGAAARGEDLST